MPERFASKQKLINNAYKKIFIANVFVLLATNIGMIVDNIVVGRLLGTNGLAAIGFFAPLSTAVGFSYVLISGAQVICSNLVGAGKRSNLNTLFVSSFVTLAGLAAIFAALATAFRDPLATLLGASGAVHKELCDYMAGYLVGVIPQILCAFLMGLVAFNNRIKDSYISTAVMVVTNLLGDLLLIGSWGSFGVGLASTISSLCGLLVLIPGFISKDRTIHFCKVKFDVPLVFRAMGRGIPSLSFAFGLMCKTTLMNYAINTYIGAEGIAVVNVMNSICAIAGIIPQACATGFATIAGIYYGEEDRDSILYLFKHGMKSGVILCTATMLVLMIFSNPLARVFLTQGDDIISLGQRMILLGYTFLPFNIIFCNLLKSYQAQGRMTLVNIMSFVETALIGVTALLLTSIFGDVGAWLANAIVDIVCIGIVLVSVFVWKKSIDFSPESLLKLPDDFGAKPDEFIEFSVKNLDDVSSVSEAVVDFCKKRNVSGKNAFYSGLCVEEMARNVLQHGFTSDKTYYADVRVVAKDELTIRIQDNCKEFDPRKRMDMMNPEDPEKNIGIRLVAGISKSIDYYNTAGINTLLIKV
jgi:Na+-driven multidrug efflux pump/anti-sigma regulatory factor (Ser/Thr protein kinase)